MAPPRSMAMAEDNFKIQRRRSSECDLDSHATRRALMEAFAAADTNASGFVDREELTRVLTKTEVHMQNPAEDIDAIFEAFDVDGDGAINVVDVCAKFEPAIERNGCTMMGGKMDLDSIMKETFDKMLVDARDQRTAVNRSFMQAGEDCRDWFCKKFLGSKWRMKTFDEFTKGGKGCASRLAHLRANLSEASKGENKWVNTALVSDTDFKNEVLDKNGICDFAEKWLSRLECEIADIWASKRRHLSEINRTTSLLSEASTRTFSLEESASMSALADTFERLATA
ncbi:hypothetical protein T484DRAFT_1860308 [Baffinella frigidus]|nr:hypothetical protein T484DRAFT_1860308 [Cryptophyta sp. CCMP2293]